MKYSGISNLVRKFLLALCLGLAPLAVSATAIIDNGIYSTDDDTGLDWLDLTETAGMSFNEVSAELGPGGAFEGWSYATPSDVATLITNFGGTPPYNGWNSANDMLVALTITPLIGDLDPDPSIYSSFGITFDPATPSLIHVSRLLDYWLYGNGVTQDYIRIYEATGQFDDASADTGSFLIRGTGGQNLVLGSPPSPPSGSVPGPATFPLLLLGLAVLALQRRRRGLTAA